MIKKRWVVVVERLIAYLKCAKEGTSAWILMNIILDWMFVTLYVLSISAMKGFKKSSAKLIAFKPSKLSRYMHMPLTSSGFSAMKFSRRSFVSKNLLLSNNNLIWLKKSSKLLSRLSPKDFSKNLTISVSVITH